MSKPRTLEELNTLYKEIFYLEDEAILPLLVSIIVGARLNAPPVWMYLVGPSSGGKTALLSVFSKVSYSHQISDLTANTFLSGMGGAGEREPSLLKRLGTNFVIIMKDFTTILSKAPETQEAVIAQMREIYDGHLRKETGVGHTIEWGTKEKPNKATFVMASTEAIYKVQEKFADMGTRAVNYVMLPQDRKKTTKIALKNNNTLGKDIEKIQDAIAQFVDSKVNDVPESLPILSNELEDEIIDIADFSSICRSVVLRNYRGEKNLALSAELPMRMAKQLLSAGQFMAYCNNGVLTEAYKQAIFKIGLDSIPKQRRLILDVLARHPKVNVVGVAQKINYPPQFTREWMEDLNMFGVLDVRSHKNKEYWSMKEDYRKIMQKYLGVVTVAEDLEGELEGGASWSDGRDVDASWSTTDANAVADKMFDAI